METTIITATQSSTVHTPADFTDQTNDPNRYQWTAGALRHVIAALDGDAVALTLDERTGYTALNVQLVRVAFNSSGSPELYARHNYSNGKSDVITHYASKLGPAIINLVGRTDGGSTRQTALDTWRYEQRVVRELATASATAPAEGARGRYKITAHDYMVDVTFEPLTRDSEGRDIRDWTAPAPSWRFGLTDIVAAVNALMDREIERAIEYGHDSLIPFMTKDRARIRAAFNRML